MRYFAVIDTNVLVSALFSRHPDTATVQIIEKVYTGEIIPLYSDSILEEYEEVLCRPKFHFSVSMIHTLIGSIKTNGISVNPSPTGAELPDMDDLVFYEVVMEKQTDNAYLVTGNIRHFPKEPFIVTPNEMLDIIRSGSAPTRE